MPDARVLENHYISRHGDTALPCRCRGRGNLPPTRLPSVGHPQVEGIGSQAHGIDLGVGPAHETYALVGAIGPGRAARTVLHAILDYPLWESWRDRWIRAAGHLVPGKVAVRVAN